MLKGLTILALMAAPAVSADLEQHIAALKNQDKEGRIKAAKALEKLGPQAEPAIPALIACLNDPRPEDYNVRVATLCGRALIAIGEPAIEPLLKALKSPDILTFTGAAEAFMHMDNPPDAALETLFQALQDRSAGGNPGLRPKQRGWVAARVLAKYGKRAQPATGDLIEMLHSENFHEQVAACAALAGIGASAKTAVPKLVELVDEGVASVRGHAALALAGIGPVPDTDIVTPIAKATNDFSAIVRARALMSLGRLGPAAKSALPQVQKHLRNKQYRNRAEAAYAAYRITDDPTESLQVLAELSRDLNYELDALLMTRKMGAGAKAAAPDLIRLLTTKDSDKRFEIVRTLAEVAGDDPAVRQQLSKLASSDPNEDVRQAAAQALKQPTNEKPQ